MNTLLRRSACAFAEHYEAQNARFMTMFAATKDDDGLFVLRKRHDGSTSSWKYLGAFETIADAEAHIRAKHVHLVAELEVGATLPA